MGKRQVRIFKEDLEKKLPELLQQPVVQVVLSTKVVLTGTLSDKGEGILQLKDFRAGKHNFTTGQVEEIIYDIEAAY